MSSNERFRTELAANLARFLPPEQLRNALQAFDVTSGSYDINLKPIELATTSGYPEPVKWFIAAKAVANCSMGTLKQYKYRLEEFFQTVQKPVQSIDANDIRMYLHVFKEKHNASDCYMDGIRRILSSFFAWLVNNDYLFRNPVVKVEHIKYQEKEREPLSQYDLEVIRWECKTIREKAIVDFLFSTGCRAAECVAVCLDDIDWQNRKVIIRHGKGNKRRTVFFNAESELTLRKYLETRTDDCPALFVTARRPFRPLAIRTLEVIVRNIGKRVSLESYPHRYRHTFATSGLRAGIPLDQIQALMGHESPQTTLRYAKHDLEDLQRSHRRAYA